MTAGTGEGRSARTGQRFLWAVGALAAIVALVPPVGILARRYVFVEAFQFSVLAVVVPALVVLGAPWTTRADEVVVMDRPSELVRHDAIGSLAARRARHPGVTPSLVTLAVFVGVAIAWRVPPAVDALERYPGLSVLEAASLFAAGSALWLELVPSPPFRPRTPYPMRIALAAVAMWSIWIVGYLLGMSRSAWFPSFTHSSTSAFSLIADQQLAAGALFFVAAVGFVPFIFISLFAWLGNSEDADDELHRMIRSERRRRRWTDPDIGGFEPPARPPGPETPPDRSR